MFKGNTKEVWIGGLALFSLFFGAGNLILPPYLGKQAGNDWLLVALGFAITAVVIPIIGILAQARLQGTMYDFAKKISPWFSTLYCILIYSISITLASPRTASVTYEMGIAPFFDVSSLLSSTMYFALVFLFVMNRSKLLNIIGKFLTPLIVFILFLIIVIAISAPPETMTSSSFEAPVVAGLLEGYQTFDAIGAIVVGGVVIISLNLKGFTSYTEKKQLITKSGLIAGAGLFLIYAGLIWSGALFGNSFQEDIIRTEVLSGLSSLTLGNLGASFLSVLVALACFTTAVGIVTGTADYFKGVFKESKLAYTITAIIGSVLGVVMGQFDVHYIIDIALPVLMFIYPITIVLIVLNILPERFATPMLFRSVVIVTFLFSIPDFLKFFVPSASLEWMLDLIPLAQNSLGWVLPAVLTAIIVLLFSSKTENSSA